MQVNVNGVELCVETFGDPADPPVPLIGLTMRVGRTRCARRWPGYVVRTT